MVDIFEQQNVHVATMNGVCQGAGCSGGGILTVKGSTFSASRWADDELSGYFYTWSGESTVGCSVTLLMFPLQLLALLTPCCFQGFRESLLSLAALCVSEHLTELFGKYVWMRRIYLLNGGCPLNQGYLKPQTGNLRSYVVRTVSLSLGQGRVRFYIRRSSFTASVIEHWNRILREVV